MARKKKAGGGNRARASARNRSTGGRGRMTAGQRVLGGMIAQEAARDARGRGDTRALAAANNLADRAAGAAGAAG